MRIKTIKLQEMLSKAVKGVGNNKLLPITSLMALEVKDGVFTIITTDSNNYLYVFDKIESEDEFYATIEADTFSKLVARTTSDTIDLTIDGNILKVTGNGTYTIALPLEPETGENVKYPDPARTGEKGEQIGELNTTLIKTTMASLKPALATTMEIPCYTGYYVGDVMLATDTNQISSMNVAAFTTPSLITVEMMNLLDVVVDGELKAYLNGNKLMFESEHSIVYGSVLNGIDNYQVDIIRGLVEKEFPSMCSLDKDSVLQLIERIALFVDTFDDGVIGIDFTSDGVVFSNKNSSGVELVPYIESVEFKEFSGEIDLNAFRAQVKAQSSGTIELWYGDDKSIKLVDNDLTAIIALIVE